MLAQAGKLPDVAVACVGGGSNAIGLFHPLIQDESIHLLGVEAGGRGAGLGDNAASLVSGTPGVLHGCLSMLLHDEHGQVYETHSVSAGLDYPAVGPEHALLQLTGRAEYVAVDDQQALEALNECCALEGILPAIETAHAFYGAKSYAKANPGSAVLIGVSGRGDKDLPTLQQVSKVGGTMTGIQHITDAIKAAKEDGRPALVAFMTGGFPTKKGFQANLESLTTNADIVEIGVPFTDPMADGVTIQNSSQAALAQGVTISWILDEIARKGLAGSCASNELLNPLLSLGDKLGSRCQAAGVAGIICPDLPLDESDILKPDLDKHGIALVNLVTPVTTDERLSQLCETATGFVYAVTVTGTTGGAKSGGPAEMQNRLPAT